MQSNNHFTSTPILEDTSCKCYSQQQQSYRNILKGVLGDDEACRRNCEPKLNKGKHRAYEQTPGGLPPPWDWASNTPGGSDFLWSRRIPDCEMLILQLMCNQIQTLQADVRELKTEVFHSYQKFADRPFVISDPEHIDIEAQSLHKNASSFVTKPGCWVQAEKSGRTREFVSQELKNMAARHKWVKNETVTFKRRSRPSSDCFKESRAKKTRVVAHKLHLRSQWLKANWFSRGNWHSHPKIKTFISSKSGDLKSILRSEKFQRSRSWLKPDPDRDRTLRKKPNCSRAKRCWYKQVSSAKPTPQRPLEDPITTQSASEISQRETLPMVPEVDCEYDDSSEEMLSSEIDHNRFKPREVGGYSADDEFW